MKDKLGRYLFFVGIVLLLVIAVIWQLPKSKKDNVASSAVESEIEVTSETEDGNEADSDEKKDHEEAEEKDGDEKATMSDGSKMQDEGSSKKENSAKAINEKKLYSTIIRQMKSFFFFFLSVYDSKIINYLNRDEYGYQSELLMPSSDSLIFTLDSQGYCKWADDLDLYCNTYEIIYCYYDINKDGIDELLVGETTDFFYYEYPTIKDIWTVSDGELVFLINGDDNRGVNLTTDGNLYCTYDYAHESQGVCILKITPAGKLNQEYDLEQKLDEANADYLCYSENGNEITEAQYIRKLQKIQEAVSLVDLENLHWETLYKYK